MRYAAALVPALAPLLARDPWLRLKGLELHVGPSEHVVRRVRFIPNRPNIVLVDAMSEVGVVFPHIDEVYIHRFSLNQFRAPFAYPDLDKPGDCERMVAMLGNRYIPLLRTIDDLHAFRTYVSSDLVMNQEFQRAPYTWTVLFDLAMGKINAARTYTAERRAGWADPPAWKKLAPDALRFLRDLDAALWSGDPSSAFAVLQTREREVIEELGITEIWRLTPCPGESGGGVSKITDTEAFVDIFREATKRAAAMMRYRIAPLLLAVVKRKLRNDKPKRKEPATG